MPALSRRVIVFGDGALAALAPGRPATIADTWGYLAERQEAWRALIEASQSAPPPDIVPANENRRHARSN